jgi:endoglucanase
MIVEQGITDRASDLPNFALLKRLAEAPGVPGREESVRAIVRDELVGLVDELRSDPLGDVIGIRLGRTDTQVLLLAHMDEVGFIVKWIDPSGFVRVQPLGYTDASVALAQRVVISTRAAGLLRGVLQATRIPPVPRSLTEPRPQLHLDDLYVDLGMSADQVNACVEVGDPVTMDRTCEQAGDAIVSKALDDRAGLFVLIEALRSFRGHAATVYAAATVREEGAAQAGAQAVGSAFRPTVAIAIDAANARDTPGAGAEHTQTALGRGPGLKIRDMGSVSHPGLVRHMRAVAERHAIPYQLEINPWGATDIHVVQGLHGGVPTMTLSIPTRYVHTPNEMVSVRDLQACIALLGRYLEEAHTGDYAL